MKPHCCTSGAVQILGLGTHLQVEVLKRDRFYGMIYLHEVNSSHGSIPLALHSVALTADPLPCPKNAQHRALPAQILPGLALVHIPCMEKGLRQRVASHMHSTALGTADNGLPSKGAENIALH